VTVEGADSVPTFDVGTRVIVRSRYLGTWGGGFMVAGVDGTGYRLGRLSDRTILPDVFPHDDVRLDRRRHPFRGTKGSYLDRRDLLWRARSGP